jgi:hypothetical protein
MGSEERLIVSDILRCRTVAEMELGGLWGRVVAGWDRLLQRFDRLPRDILTHAERLNSRFLNVLQRAYGSDMGVCSIARTKLTGAHGRPTAFSVVALAWVAPRTGGEDGGFAGLDCCEWGVEHQLVPNDFGRRGRHFEGNVAARRVEWKARVQRYGEAEMVKRHGPEARTRALLVAAQVRVLDA